MKTLVLSKNMTMWTNRTVSDEDFRIFRVLHPTVTKASVYYIFDTNYNKNIRVFIARLWCKVPTALDRQCTHCSHPINNEEIHNVFECARYERDRWRRIIADVTNIDVNSSERK